MPAKVTRYRSERNLGRRQSLLAHGDEGSSYFCPQKSNSKPTFYIQPNILPKHVGLVSVLFTCICIWYPAFGWYNNWIHDTKCAFCAVRALPLIITHANLKWLKATVTVRTIKLWLTQNITRADPDITERIPGTAAETWTPALATVPHNIRAVECAARAPRIAGLGKFRAGTKLVGRHSAIRVASRYGLGIDFWWRRDFLYSSTPTLGPTQPAVQWVPGLLTEGQKAKAWPPTPSSAEVKKQ